jgi:putative MATE family efflux protein
MNDEQKTEGVKTLLGEPKKAIIKLSGPMVIAMLAQTAYNLADGIWVAGLGSNALAAVGLFFPFIMLLIGLSSGLGVGGSAAISRRIGEQNKEGADNTAIHTILIGMGVGLAISLPFIPFLDSIFSSMGASGEATTMAAEYARILFFGAVFIFFANIGNAILRGEGDTKRAMYALVFSSVLNIVLDPIFIYTLDLGIAGAAWATLISMILAAALFFYWMFVTRDTFVNLQRRDFQPDRAIMREILGVGIPSSVAMLSMSFSVFLLNLIILQIEGNDGVAVFTTGWRIVSFGTLPLLGIATGVTAVTAAAYGAHNPDKLEIAFMYAIKIGIIVELAVATIVFVFAPQITAVFTYSEDAQILADDIILFLRYTAVFYPSVPLGMLTSALFRGINKGMNALIVTIIRAVILQVSIAYILGITVGYGLEGVWLGIVTGNLLAGIAVTFPWGILSIRRFRQQVNSVPVKET